MDLIYQGAFVTIVAAFGEDANAGLSGVGNTPRDTQPIVTVGNVSLVSTMMHHCLTIEESAWASRGWTLREAVMSRRKLCFTRNQVYFECEAMSCYETMTVNLESELKDILSS
jgi:hypothetical protein